MDVVVLPLQKKVENLFMEKKRNRNLIIKMLVTFGALALSILLYFFIKNLNEIQNFAGSLTFILRPFVYGGVFAYLLKPICKWFEEKLLLLFNNRKKELCESLAVFASIIIGLTIIVALLVIIIPNMFESLLILSQTLPGKTETLVKVIQKKLAEDPVILNYFNMVYDSVNKMFTNWIDKSLIPQLQVILTGIGTSVKNIVFVFKDIFIGMIVSIYFLKGRKKFSSQGKLVMHSIFKEPIANTILKEITFADKMFTGFIAGKIIDSTIIGLICYVFCLVTDMPNTILVSVIVGITNVIPFFGPYIGVVPSLLLICIDSPMKAVWFLVFIAILQQVDGNIIGPKILGDSTGLSSFWVLFSIMFFGGMYGIVGMLIGVPLFAVIYDIIRKLVIRGLRRNNCSYYMTEYEQSK